jgi:hypothetical protein
LLQNEGFAAASFLFLMISLKMNGFSGGRQRGEGRGKLTAGLQKFTAITVLQPAFTVLQHSLTF